MAEQQIIGEWGETFALHFLEENGLSLITRNFSCKLGEIDLILNDKETLVFVEVRVRNKTLYGSPLETITAKKQRNVRLTAIFYMQKMHYQKDCRIDVIGIDTSTNPPTIEWIKNAF